MHPGKYLVALTGTCLALTLGGCGGGGGGTTPTAPTAVSGFVIVPDGTGGTAPLVARTQTVAAVALEPAAGGTVRLFLADMAGVVQDESTPLATGTIDADGRYSLNVPAGVPLTANLIIIATYGDSHELRAQLVGTVTDIDPVSDYVLAQTGDVGLSYVSPADVLVVRGFIDREDGADPTTDFGAGSVLGDALAEVVEDVAADDTSVTVPTGTMTWTEFSPHVWTYSGSKISARRGTATFTPGPTPIQAANSVVETVATMGYGFNTGSYMGFTCPPEETEGPSPSSPAQIEPDGGFTFADPVEEELFPENGAGTRICGGLTRSRSLGHGSWVTVSQCLALGYSLTDGALDLTSPTGRSTDLGLQCHIMKGSLARTAIAGPTGTPAHYALITFNSHFESAGTRSMGSSVSLVDITEGDADGAVAFAKGGETDFSLQRSFDTGTGTVTVELSSDSPSESEGGTGTLDPATGLVAMDDGGELQFSDAGAFMTYMESDRDDNPVADVWGDFEWGVGMKLGTENPTIIDGTRYRVVMLRIRYGDDGSTELQQSTQTWATYAAGPPASLTFDGVVGRVRQGSDEMNNTLTSTVSAFEPTYDFSWSDISTGVGRFELASTGSGAQGFFSAEGVGIAAFWDGTPVSKALPTSAGTLGVMFLIPTPVTAP